jgi:hypothetical protein
MKKKLDISDVFDRTFKVYTDQAFLLIPAALLVFLPVAVINGVLQSKISGLIIALSVVVSVIATVWFEGMVVQAVRSNLQGKGRMSVGAMFESAAPFVPALLAAGLLAALGILGGFILLIVPGLYLFTMWALISPVIVIEGAAVMDSFSRSRTLVTGNGWQVFGVLVLVLILNGIGAAVLGSLFHDIASSSVGNGLSSLITNALLAPFFGIVTAVMYFELALGAAPPPAEGASLG